jgi:hypothetical protein
MAELRERPTDAWYRPLHDGRIEVMCRAPGYRLRVAAPGEQAWQAVELFEQWTGLEVRCERRPRRRPTITKGQLSLAMTELQTEGNG